MPLVIYEVSLVGRGPSGEAIVNVFHYVSTSGAGNLLEASNLADSFDTVVGGPFGAAVTVDWHGFAVNVAVVRGAGLGTTFSKDINGEDGERAGPSTPLQTTYIIRKLTNTGGRHGRGRAYISPIPDGLVDVDGRVDTGDGPINALRTAMEANLTTLEANFTPCVWQKGTDTYHLVVATQVSPLAGVQRSRRVRFPN